MLVQIEPSLNVDTSSYSMPSLHVDTFSYSVPSLNVDTGSLLLNASRLFTLKICSWRELQSRMALGEKNKSGNYIAFE